MVYKLTIPYTLPSLNTYINESRRNKYKGANFKDKHESGVIKLINIQLRRVKFDKPVYMSYRWHEKDKRRDWDNVSSCGRKIIQDAFVKAGVLKNDGWNDIIGFYDDFTVDKRNPRIEVMITDERDIYIYHLTHVLRIKLNETYENA